MPASSYLHGEKLKKKGTKKTWRPNVRRTQAQQLESRNLKYTQHFARRGTDTRADRNSTQPHHLHTRTTILSISGQMAQLKPPLLEISLQRGQASNLTTSSQENLCRGFVDRSIHKNRLHASSPRLNRQLSSSMTCYGLSASCRCKAVAAKCQFAESMPSFHHSTRRETAHACRKHLVRAFLE